MPAHFFDTSALAKRDLREPGAAAVDGLLAAPGPHVVARLGLVEAHSAFAKAVRVGRSSPAGFLANRRRLGRTAGPECSGSRG